MKVRLNNKKVLIVMLIILLLILAVGYAILSDSLTITGTANAKGTFDLEFQNAEIVKNIGANEEKTTAEISADKNTLTVNVGDLAYPGAGVEFSVDIVNVGTMPAEVQAVTPTNITGSEKIKITGLEEIKVGHPKIEVEDRCKIHFTVEWPEDVTNILDNESKLNFGLKIEYTQSTGETGGEIIPDYTIPTGLIATYGKKLADIELPEGFKFQDSLETLVGNVGINSFKVTYTSEDNKEIKDIEVLIEVEKAIPQYTVPTGLTANYGQKLSDIKLPTGFRFQDSLETLVGNGGIDRFKVTYTPTDTNNYNEVTDIEVVINVIYPTLMSQITAEDYGKSINYVATVKNNNTNQNQEVNNWKVLYNDKSQYIYIILEDYLPIELVPSGAGLNTAGTYQVYSSTNRNTLLNGLKGSSYWSEFANGVAGATATGTPEYEILFKSYNEKNGKTEITDPTKVSNHFVENTDTLYFPHNSGYKACLGYWFSALYQYASTGLWAAYFDGGISGGAYDNTNKIGVRPVVKLPSTVKGVVEDLIEIKK